MVDTKDQKVIDFWQSFLRTESGGDEAAKAGFQAWSFGSDPEMADELGNLVLRGIKTATASLVWSYDSGGDPYPVIGGYSIILDGLSLPLCIIRTDRLYTVPFCEVDAEQAFLEGEGDRSLAFWREVHWKFFSDECLLIGKEPDQEMPVLCERFSLVFSGS